MRVWIGPTKHNKKIKKERGWIVVGLMVPKRV